MNWFGIVAAAALTTQGFGFEVSDAPSDSGGLANWPAAPARFANGVTGIGDIVFAQPLHYRPLRLDVYRPEGDGPHPLLIHVHGGAWVKGTKRLGGPVADYPAVLAQLAAKGFVVASIEYRLDGEAPFPAAIHDVKAAIRFLRRHADEYGLDPARVGIFGESAGGQLSALAATSCGVAAFDPPWDNAPDAPSDCVQAAAPWYGVYDFATIPVPAGNTGPGPYLGCPERLCPVETLNFASPRTYLDASDPPLLLIHGTADKLVAVSQTHEFEAAARAARVDVTALYLPGVDHGLRGSTAEETAAAVGQALDATAAFFKSQLK